MSFQGHFWNTERAPSNIIWMLFDCIFFQIILFILLKMLGGHVPRFLRSCDFPTTGGWGLLPHRPVCQQGFGGMLHQKSLPCPQGHYYGKVTGFYGEIQFLRAEATGMCFCGEGLSLRTSPLWVAPYIQLEGRVILLVKEHK